MTRFRRQTKSEIRNLQELAIHLSQNFEQKPSQERTEILEAFSKISERFEALKKVDPVIPSIPDSRSPKITRETSSVPNIIEQISDGMLAVDRNWVPTSG
jgi:hypothetical protein